MTSAHVGLAPSQSPPTRLLDRLNPLTRVAIGLVMLVPLVITIDWLSAAIVLLGELLGVLLLGVKLPQLLRRLLPIFLVAPIGALSMALYGKPGGRVHLDWGVIVVSDQSLALAGAVLVRVFALALPAIALMGSLDPTDLADALAQILKLPARFVLGTLAGVRMVGLFVDDWRALGQARRARGLGDQGRLRRWASMAFGLLVQALRRGTSLATSMEARGFGGNQRTWARSSRLTGADAIAMLVTLLLAAGAVMAAIVFDTLWITG
ncbi:energy-coupling factor transporter transmembrane component T family protein [Aestuariimicrobium ganziense]|uniref:energy-coupling factor transporter transmembrane component T family protein n=1 Tax=Aestuariimicrobium ganziense TaxID=2773677 RepID=UPI0019447C0B|nr:energy-coupling factor transporter transmembrane component T [Aestuariimicrobium ganziense]